MTGLERNADVVYMAELCAAVLPHKLYAVGNKYDLVY